MGKKDKSKPDQTSYEAQLHLLQIELVKLQNSLISKGDQILVILEGRDTAGKDGTIKAITQHLSPEKLAWLPLENHPMLKMPNGTFNVMWLNSPKREKYFSLIAVGITALVLSA